LIFLFRDSIWNKGLRGSSNKKSCVIFTSFRLTTACIYVCVPQGVQFVESHSGRGSKEGFIVDDNSVNRRQFVQHAAQIGAALGMAGRALGARPGKTGRVIGANDRINIGAIGVGGRGSYLVDEFSGIGERNNGCQIVAVCDVYRKRARINAEKHKCESTLDTARSSTGRTSMRC
jgi:hypothetical protein